VWKLCFTCLAHLMLCLGLIKGADCPLDIALENMVNAARAGLTLHCMAWHGTAWHGMAWHDIDMVLNV
jgi:hypothetical protein